MPSAGPLAALLALLLALPATVAAPPDARLASPAAGYGTDACLILFCLWSEGPLDCDGKVYTLGTGGEGQFTTYYVDDRDLLVGGVWVYAESNGVSGLQSGGGPSPLGDFDSCQHPSGSYDTLLF